MRKFISAVTSLAMAATMVSAVAPIVTSAATKDTAKSFSIKTYAESDSKYASAGSEVTVSAEDIAAGEVTIPCGIYLGANIADETSLSVQFAVHGGAGAGDIVIKKYEAKDAYFSTPKEFTLADGTTYSSTAPLLWRGTYDSDFDEFMPLGTYMINASKGSKTGNEDNYVYGCSWECDANKDGWTGAASEDHPFAVFDAVLPKGLPAGKYTLDFLTYNTNLMDPDKYNPASMIENGQRYQEDKGNLTLNSMTINVEGDEVDPSTTTTTTTTTKPVATTTSSKKVDSDADIVYDFGKYEATADSDVNVWVTITANGNPIAASEFNFVIDSPLELTSIGAQSPALAKASVMSNIGEKTASCVSLVTGSSGATDTPCTPEDGGRVLLLKIHVPKGCPDGEYKVTFGDTLDIKANNQGASAYKNIEVIDGIIKVGDGKPTSTTSTSSSTTTTTTTTSAKPATTTTTAPNPPSDELAPDWGDVNVDGKVNISDVVLLNKWLNDNKDYNMSDQGKVNADCCDPQDAKGGKVKVSGVKITAADSDAIIRSIVHLVELPTSSK